MSVLVVIEQSAGKLHPMSLEAAAAAQQAAQGTGKTLTAVLLGKDAPAAAATLADKKLDRIHTIEHALLDQYTADGYTAALEQTLRKLTPDVVIFPNTYQARDYAPKLATRFERPLISDITGLRADDGRLVFVRLLFQGKLNADVVAQGDGPTFVSVQSGAFRADTLALGDAPAPVESIAVGLEAAQVRVQPGEPYQESAGGVDLTSAERIVSVGRGIKEPDNIALVERLAALLGAELAASRPICDSGWLPLERQVGSSGQTVSPKLYLALGISGAIQHVVGMKGAKTIVAVNKDASAPIFEIADYGIVGDLFDVVPAMIEALEG